ncbi:MAG: hypothetical protein AAF212_05765 [Verrucomicrobiota bacterium]
MLQSLDSRKEQASPKEDLEAKIHRKASPPSYKVQDDPGKKEAYDMLNSIEEFQKQADPEKNKDMER